MLKNANFLCEIGTEEIPAGYLPPAIEAIKKLFDKQLNEKRIDAGTIEVFATPRRIAILIENLSDAQKDEIVEMKGPSKKAAYDAEGNPTKALQGFLKGNGLDIEDVSSRETDKGEYIFAEKKLDSKPTAVIIPEIIDEIIKNLPFPKRMKWSDREITFPRPVRYFLLLFNGEIVPYEIDGIAASDQTRGHFVQSNVMIDINDINSYEKQLEDNSVIIDQNKRKEFIRRELLIAAEKAGGVLNEDEELLDTVTFLVENPHIGICEFDRDFLAIPDIVLIAEMKEHQKYFAIMDKDGKLINKFLIISNNPVTDYIIKGNVRVITARFNDARFFYDEDRKEKLEDRIESLKSVLFHRELGSIYDKVERMLSAAKVISSELSLDAETSKKIERAVMLSKTDLNTAMVFEFTSLQGQIGKIYALNDGEDPDVACAIDEHYRPRFHGDEIPENIVSVVLSLAEKFDNIFGSFSVGNIPKGSADPYALRRQANAIVEILIRQSVNLSVERVLGAIASNYKEGGSLVKSILDFITARARTIFSDNGLNYDEIDACLSTGQSDYLELFRRASSINEFRKNVQFTEMLLGFKRMNNIVNAFRKDNPEYKLNFNLSLLEDQEEKDLHGFFDSKRQDIASFIKESCYIELFQLLIEGKSIIDSFFDKVLVMDKRIDVRDSRLAMLEDILSYFTNLLDFSKISDK